MKNGWFYIYKLKGLSFIAWLGNQHCASLQKRRSADRDTCLVLLVCRKSSKGRCQKKNGTCGNFSQVGDPSLLFGTIWFVKKKGLFCISGLYDRGCFSDLIRSATLVTGGMGKACHPPPTSLLQYCEKQTKQWRLAGITGY